MRRQSHVQHRMPGRVRFKVPDAKGNHELLRQIDQVASSVKGVRQVHTNPVTGSVVIHYDKSDPEAEQRLEQAFREESELLSFAFPELREIEKLAGFFEADTEFLEKRSRAAAGLFGFVRSVNLELKRATNNAVDLQLLFPLAFAGVSLLFASKRKDPLMAMMFLLASFHSFVVLQRPATSVSAK